MAAAAAAAAVSLYELYSREWQAGIGHAGPVWGEEGYHKTPVTVILLIAHILSSAKTS